MATIYSYSLDPFQRHAVAAIHRGHNVLVCAKTGSGKTLVAEYAIAYALSKGLRVFYTSPIKSLSNQKFHDLTLQFPGASVGIMTGDIKYMPQAQIIVMTTEILRNLLYKRGSVTEHVGLTAALSLEDVGCVVFDECHYMNDPERGAVWEECFILLPPAVRMIMLSATLDRPGDFADWLGGLKAVPVALIQTAYRVVPLTHYVTEPGTHRLIPIMDAKEHYDAEAYKAWLRDRKRTAHDKDKFKEKVRDARAAGVEGAIDGKVRTESFTHTFVETVEALCRGDLMPALFFVFSRKDCERYAGLVCGSLFGDDMDAGFHAHRTFDFHLRHHKKELETLPVYHTLRELVGRGIAFHHSGLLPVLKEVIELLFSGGFLKLMVATETFAVGLNMPTRTVVFTSIRKYADDCDGLRLLRHDEYMQMAGRAGRRGKDVVGHVVYLPEREPVGVFELGSVLKGALPPLASNMKFDYDFLLKCMNQGLSWMDVLHKTYWYKAHEKEVAAIQAEYAAAVRAAEASKPQEPYYSELVVKHAWTVQLKTAANAERKAIQRTIEVWKNRHIGPRWAGAEKDYEDYAKKLDAAERIRRTLGGLTAYSAPVETVKTYLEACGFIGEDGALTAVGVAASELNECHPLLMSKLFYSACLEDLDLCDIVGLCAAFVDVGKIDDAPALESIRMSDGLRGVYVKLESIRGELMRAERVPSEPAYWTLHTGLIEPLMEWISGNEGTDEVHIGALCADYGMFEGNFVKAVLKVSNIIDELISISTLANNTRLLEKLEGARARLVRSVVVPDSLYLHL
jgi:superfamily II RNA helicase